MSLKDFFIITYFLSGYQKYNSHVSAFTFFYISSYSNFFTIMYVFNIPLHIIKMGITTFRVY